VAGDEDLVDGLEGEHAEDQPGHFADVPNVLPADGNEPQQAGEAEGGEYEERRSIGQRCQRRLKEGEGVLSDYRAADSNWPEGNVHHYFCSRCGVRAFSRGYLEMEPFNGWFHAVNVACLDDASDEEFAAAPIQYEDGRNDNWDNPPAVTRYL
jgi:hypothetical protein